MKIAQPVSLTLLMLFLAIPIAAQSPPKTCSRSLLVNVINEDNNRVGSFGSDNFNIAVNGENVKPEVKRGLQHSPVLILIQTSPGMLKLAGTEKAVLNDILSRMPDGMPIGVMVFNSEPQLIAAFSLDRKASVEAFETYSSDSKNWGNRADIEKAVSTAIDTLKSQSTGGSIIMISNAGSRTGPPSAAIKKLVSSGIRFYAHLFDFHQPLTPEESESYQYFTELTEKSGGIQMWEASTQSNPNPLLIPVHDSIIVGEAAYPYELRFNQPITAKWNSIKITLAADAIAGADKLRIKYPHQLPPCTN